MYYKTQYDYASEHLSAEQEVQMFCRKYEAQAGLSRDKLYAKRMPVSYRQWVNDGGPIPFHQEVQREPMIEVYMPQERFKQLVERERWYSNLERESDYYKGIVEQYRNDERVRDRNPSVQKAWEKYLMLLEMAR